VGSVKSNGFAQDLRNSGRGDAICGLEGLTPLPTATPPVMAVCKPLWAHEEFTVDESMVESMERQVSSDGSEDVQVVQTAESDIDDMPAVVKTTSDKKWVTFKRLNSLVSVGTARTSTRTSARSFERSQTLASTATTDADVKRNGFATAKSGKRRLSALERMSKAPKKRSKLNSFRRARTLNYEMFNTADSSWAQKMCSGIGKFLESSISIFILLNGIFIGVQTDYQARHVTETLPGIFPALEIIFCLIFTMELSIKLSLWRWKFFTMKGVWAWNCFDFFLVFFQIVEVIGLLAAEAQTPSSATNPVGNVSFLRLLRILRLFRVLRLVRLLHFIGELAMIISSIANCFRALCWTVLLMFMMIYMVAIVITQVVLTHRVTLKNDGHEDSVDLKRWWGDLGQATLSLYQATLGGVDWEVVERPMRTEIEWGPLLSIMFSLYIAFALLAMMNIITGTFVQSALQNAEHERIEDFRFIASDAFKNKDAGAEQYSHIQFDDFERTITDGGFSDWLKSMGIESADARLLFQLLDRDNAQVVDSEKLISNMVRLREGAKFMDIMKLMYEHERVASKVEEWNYTESFEKELTAMSLRVSESVLEKVLARFQHIAEGGNGVVKNSFNDMNGNGKPHGFSPHAGDYAMGVQYSNGIASRPSSTRPRSTLSSNRPRSTNDIRPRSAGSWVGLPFEIEEVVEEV